MSAPHPPHYTGKPACTEPEKARLHLDGIFTCEQSQQLVHILQGVAMENLNTMRDLAVSRASVGDGVDKNTAFGVCLRRIPGWNRVIITAEKELWLGRYPQLAQLFEFVYQKCLRSYNKVYAIQEKGVLTPALSDFLYFFLCNVVGANEVSDMRIFTMSQEKVHIAMVRAIRQTLLDCVTIMYFGSALNK